MIRRLDYKVPGGKLLRLRAELDGDVLKSITIAGDFFIHPEDAIMLLEASLNGVSVKDRECLSRTVAEVLEGAVLVGFSEDDLIDSIGML